MISLSHRAPFGSALTGFSRALHGALEQLRFSTEEITPALRGPTLSPVEFPALSPDQLQEQRYGVGRQEGDR